MQRVDCHNRAAHSFELPDRAIDDAISTGEISAQLPFVRKVGPELIEVQYAGDDAARSLPAGLASFYQQKYPQVADKRSSEIRRAGAALLAIYRRNLFPDLTVTWGLIPTIWAIPVLPAASAVTMTITPQAQKEHHTGLRRLPPSAGSRRNIAGNLQNSWDDRADSQCGKKVNSI
jgi:hypothetical protein